MLYVYLFFFFFPDLRSDRMLECTIKIISYVVSFNLHNSRVYYYSFQWIIKENDLQQWLFFRLCFFSTRILKQIFYCANHWNFESFMKKNNNNVSHKRDFVQKRFLFGKIIFFKHFLNRNWAYRVSILSETRKIDRFAPYSLYWVL